MATTLYEYGTPCLGGYVHSRKIFLTFPHWGVQCIDTKTNSILSTWNRPTTNDQFTTPISYSNDNKWLISSIFNETDKKCNILLWNTNDLEIKNKIICLDETKLNKSEFIIRIFHSHICHHYFIIITNFGNIIFFNPNTKTFDYASNRKTKTDKNSDKKQIINVKLHDAISSSGYHKKLTHISFISNCNKMEIIAISFNTKSNSLCVHDSICLSLPKDINFIINDDDEDEDDDIINKYVIDYDWCLDTNNLLLLMNNGCIQCIEYIHGKNTNLLKWKYKLKYKIDITQYFDISILNGRNLDKLKTDNLLYSMYNSSLLSLIGLKFIESSQFILIGPCNTDYNTYKLWTFESEHGFLRDNITLIAQNINSNLLNIAPLICIRHRDDNYTLIDIYIITSKQVLSVRLPSFGKSLLDLVTISIQNEEEKEEEEDNNIDDDDTVIILRLNNIKRIKRFLNKNDWNDAKILLNELKEHNIFIHQSLFNLMISKFVENEKWKLIKDYFILIQNYNETDLLYLLSLIMSHYKYFIENESFLLCFNTILSIKINDIFMKRCIQILPQSQVEILVQYLCNTLHSKYDEKSSSNNTLKMDVIINWLNILLDAHLGTIAFIDNLNNNEKMKNSIFKIRDFLRNYDIKIKSMMNIQANIHCILNGIKIKNENNAKNQKENKNGIKTMHGIGGGAFGFNTTKNNNQNDPNLYKDYVVEYIKL